MITTRDFLVNGHQAKYADLLVAETIWFFKSSRCLHQSEGNRMIDPRSPHPLLRIKPCKQLPLTDTRLFMVPKRRRKGEKISEILFNQKITSAYKSLTAMSPYATMDEDICNIAKDKHVSLALLPFHRQQTADGQMEEEGNSAVRRVNQNVLEKASCSVVVFVDQGFGSLGYPHCRIFMFLFCGPDYWEALSYSWRMVGHPLAMLTVIRFIP